MRMTVKIVLRAKTIQGQQHYHSGSRIVMARSHSVCKDHSHGYRNTPACRLDDDELERAVKSHGNAQCGPEISNPASSKASRRIPLVGKGSRLRSRVQDKGTWVGSRKADVDR